MRLKLIYLVLFRFSIWVEDSNTLLCPSGYIRNDLCMFGLEDLVVI